MIDLALPDIVPATFVVATAHPLDEPLAVARGRARLPSATDLTGTGLLRVSTSPAGESGFSELLDDAAWVDDGERYLLEKTTHHIAVIAHAPPVSQPAHAQAARAVARAVAEACGGLVYDAWSHQVMPYDFRFGAEHPEFCLADGWLAVFVQGDDDGGDGPDRPGRPVRLGTAGLHRFGLPELEAYGVPAANGLAAVTLMRCLAVGLLAEHWDWLACHPGERVRSLPPHAWAEARDIWRYWAADPPGVPSAVPPGGVGGGRVRVRLRAEDDDDFAYLAIGPPPDFGAEPGDWWNDVVDLAMPYVPAPPRRLAA